MEMIGTNGKELAVGACLHMDMPSRHAYWQRHARADARGHAAGSAFSLAWIIAEMDGI